jgi:hypothetical protein
MKKNKLPKVKATWIVATKLLKSFANKAIPQTRNRSDRVADINTPRY